MKSAVIRYVIAIATVISAPAFALQTADRPPAALSQMRDAAIAVYDSARVSDWPATSERLHTLDAAAATLPSPPGKADLTQQLRGRMQALKDAIRDQQSADAATNANWVARLADELSDAYEIRVPIDVRLLAFYGRAIQIDAIRQRPQQEKVDMADLRTVWSRVEPMVLQRNGVDVARRFTDRLAQLDGAVQKGDAANAAALLVASSDDVIALFASRRPAA